MKHATTTNTSNTPTHLTLLIMLIFQQQFLRTFGFSIASVSRNARLFSYRYTDVSTSSIQYHNLKGWRRFASSSSDNSSSQSQQEQHAQGRLLGSAKIPFTWDELKTLVKNDQLDKMSRSRSEQDRYDDYIQKIKKEWVSVADHILCSKFDFEREFDEASLRLKAKPSLEEVDFVRTSLCPNDFPYFVEDEVQHWCLWKLQENVVVNDIMIAKKELFEKLDVEEFIHFVNPPHLKSIPQIDHAHIFIRLATL